MINSPDFNNLNSGECWLFWTTFYGDFEDLGPIYEYTLFDYKSRIACTRLYNSLSMENFEDVLTAVAIPVAQNLNLDAKHLCFFENNKIPDKKNDVFINDIYGILQRNGFEINIHLLKEHDHFNILNMIKKLREDYTHRCLSYLMPFVHNGTSFKDLKICFQKYIRDYNINQLSEFDGLLNSPIGYHVKSINSEMVLPLWAYIEREY